MLTYTDLKPGTIIVVDDQPCKVVEYAFSRVQQRKPVVQTKIKNLISGKTTERGFMASDKIQEADISKKAVKFLYIKPVRGQEGNEFWFCEENNPSTRFNLPQSIVGDSYDLIKTNSIVDAVIFSAQSDDKEKQIIGIDLPAKVDLEVIEAPPSIKGNTAQGGNKQVKVETGAIINVPLFINIGDIIKINSATKEYTERVEKA